MSGNNGGDTAVLETFVNEPAHISNIMAPMRTHVSESTPNEMWLLGLLQTEIRDLQEIIELARRGEVKLIDHVSYIKRSMQDIQQLMEKLDSDVPHLRHLHDMWEQLQECPILIDPEAAQQLPLDEQLGHYTLLNMQFRRINFQICAIVIPEQLNVWLKKSRTGYAIPLHLLFGDQLPELEDRVKLLNYLAYAPGSVSGLVDVEHGLIYRYAEKRSGQVFHLLLVILTFLLALGVVAAIHSQRAILDVSLPNVATLNFVLLWFALLIGVAVHQAIDTLKGNHPPIIAIGELGMLISAIHGRIILKLLLALIAFFGLAFSDVMEPTLLNALLVGFSLNSIVEVFGSSLEKRSASQVAAFKQQLGLNTQG